MVLEKTMNPWLEIPLTDYESHMTLPGVAQAEMLATELAQALDRFQPASLAVIGCAGGNGFEHIPVTMPRVIGVDINPDYIATTRQRHGKRLPQLELHVADIQSGDLPFAPVDLIYAALVFEHLPEIEPALRNLVLRCRPGGHLVILLQQPSAHEHAVSATPYPSIQTLAAHMRLIAPLDMQERATSHGLILESGKKITLQSMKDFIVQTYRMQEK